MSRLVRTFVLAAIACMPVAAFGQGKPIANEQSITVLQGIGFGSLNSPATPVDATHPLPIACTDAANNRISCGGGGGGGSGDASASNQTAQLGAATLLNQRFGDAVSPAAGTLLSRVDLVRAAVVALGTPLQAGQLIGNSAFGINGTLPAFTTTPTMNLGTIGGAATQATLAAVAASVAGPTPAGSNTIGTVNLGTGILKGTNNGLLPGQAAPITPTPVALTASTATLIDAARLTRIGLTIQTETVPTAIVYLCFAGQTNCSASVHDMLIPSGAGIGTLFTPLFAPTGAIYGYSTAAATLAVSSWIAQ